MVFMQSVLNDLKPLDTYHFMPVVLMMCTDEVESIIKSNRFTQIKCTGRVAELVSERVLCVPG